VEEGSDPYDAGPNLVDEAITEHEDLAEVRPDEFRDETTALAQRGEGIRGRQCLLEDPEGALGRGLGDESERLID
jgi:hypothetical protein